MPAQLPTNILGLSVLAIISLRPITLNPNFVSIDSSFIVFLAIMSA